ncbi:MAG TPA: HYR domain-containing protein, partial [Nitrososphaeraceae archaeon]|nr:HYR domain-containing protein [Nitrososphaeraceae archaeon]
MSKTVYNMFNFLKMEEEKRYKSKFSSINLQPFMIRGKLIGCLVATFFLSYSIIIIQTGFAQNTQVTSSQPPSVEAPPFINARATSPSWTQVNFQVNATSPSSDSISVYCNPSSGSAFPMGSTIVLCAAKDPITSLVGYAMFNVTVKDTSAPKFKVPNSILRQADNLQGTKITYDANASDTVDGDAVTICDPPSGSTFPLGLNQVKCTATDKSGNRAETSFSVIIGQTPSEESASPEISMLTDNETNQLKSPEFPVSENITEDSTPEFPVSENITDDSTPEFPVS